MALCRLRGECGLAHAPFLFRLVNPGLPGKPFVIGLADRTKGAREKHRAGSKTLPIRFDTCRDSVPGPRAFDHDHTHPVPPLLIFVPAACGVATGWKPPLSRGALVPADPGGLQGSIEILGRLLHGAGKALLDRIDRPGRLLAS